MSGIRGMTAERRYKPIAAGSIDSAIQDRVVRDEAKQGSALLLERQLAAGQVCWPARARWIENQAKARAA